MGSILDDDINLLTTIIKRLDDYLLLEHNIAEIADATALVVIAQQTKAHL